MVSPRGPVGGLHAGEYGMLTDTAASALTPTRADSSFLLGCVTGLEIGAVLMYPVWHWLLKL
jgi:hypothetical protein